jgi:triosephosphate isomerase
MAPETKSEVQKLIASLREELRKVPSDVSIVICPPFLWIPYVAEIAEQSSGLFSLGAQDIAGEPHGAHTGEISPAMLSSLGVSHVIIGHSERRALGEGNGVVARKLRVAIDGGLTAILCVGETSREGNWHEFLREEIETAFAVLRPPDLRKLIVAYEPVWAIGGSRPDTPDDALTTALFVRKLASNRFGVPGGNLPVLYGGSIEPTTVTSFAQEDGIDGVLVGHASLDAHAFSTIATALSRQ